MQDKKTVNMMFRDIIKNAVRWDESLCLRIFNWNGKRAGDRTMRIFSRIGDGHLYGVIAAALLIFNLNVGRFILQAASFAFAFQISLQKLMKHNIRRQRPCHTISGIRNLVNLPDEFSFPSGHTAGAFIMAVLFSHLYSAFTYPLYVLASLVGFSRVYNGVHYPSDVIFGAGLGISCGYLSLSLLL